MEGTKPQNVSPLLIAEESRADLAVFALYPGGDIPRPEQEAERVKKESALPLTKREDVAFSCLSLASDYMHENRQIYQQLAKEKSPQHGMREDDVLVSVLHEMWATCYNNALSLPQSASVLDLSLQEAQDLLKPREVPERFSAQTVQMLDQAIRRFAESESPDVSDPPTFSASTASVVVAACFVIVVELVVLLVRRLTKPSHKPSQEHCSDSDVAQSASQDETPQGSSLHLERPSEENSKVAEVQEIRACIQRNGGSRRASTAGSTKGASREAPQRSS